jgi:hypothetical protein
LYLGIHVRGVVQLYTKRKQRRRNKWISSDQGGSSRVQFGQVHTDQFGQFVRTSSDLHNDITITLKSRYLWSCMSTSWNHLEVNFPMQETECPLNFPIKSYDPFSEDYAWSQQSHEVVQDSVHGGFSHSITPETQRSIHTQQGGLFLYKYPTYLWNNQDFWEWNRTPLFSCVLTNPESDSLPLCSCDFPVGLHQAASSTPNPCSWYFMFR